MDTKIYKTKEGAERGKQRIIATWPPWLNMKEKLYIVKCPSGLFRLKDYAGRVLTDKEKQEHYYEGE